MSIFSSLPNIGPVLEQQLLQAGIRSPEELRELGSEQAWLRIQAFDSSACINRLQALEGAVLGIKKTSLPPERKAELSAFYKAHKITRSAGSEQDK